MESITPMELDTLKYQVENGLTLDRELVAKLLQFYKENEKDLCEDCPFESECG